MKKYLRKMICLGKSHDDRICEECMVDGCEKDQHKWLAWPTRSITASFALVALVAEAI
jgi:hypothetical protein